MVSAVLAAGYPVCRSDAGSADEARPRFSQMSAVHCLPMFSLPDVSGRVYALAAENGRPIVVHFFATWCEACKNEFASLQKFSQSQRDQLGVFAVSVGEVPGRVRTFLKEMPVTFPVLLDADRGVAKAWSVDGLPASIVFDKNLKPILTVTGDLDWTSPDVAGAIETALQNHPSSHISDCTKEPLE